MDTAKIVNIKYERPEINLMQIDAVSGATMSSVAIMNAVEDAVNKAQ